VKNGLRVEGMRARGEEGKEKVRAFFKRRKAEKKKKTMYALQENSSKGRGRRKNRAYQKNESVQNAGKGEELPAKRRGRDRRIGGGGGGGGGKGGGRAGGEKGAQE